ncbi:MAG: metallophosphoesterase [Polyangiales bacterium]
MAKLLLLAGIVTVSACGVSSNTSGNTEATPGGDTSHPARRGSPIDEVKAACGDGGLAASGTGMARQAYLQQVSTNVASVGWVTTSTVGQHVSFTKPNGNEVMDAGAVIDELAVRVGDERQMWSKASGLEPNTIYCYGVDGSMPKTSRAGFRTAPDADSNAPVRFLAFGDSGGGGADQYALLDQMYTVPYDLMIHTGDIAYDNGTIAEFENNVFGVYAELFRSIPFFPAPGNHEYNSTADAAPFRSVFSLPGSTGKTWYSYDWGQVHFASLDTEADYDEQIAWLDRDLASSNKPWKIVYLHRPPFSSGEHGSDTGLRTKLAPVLKSRHVQLVLAGHDHDYERMIPQDGTAFVVTGGGGKGTRPVGVSDFTAYSTDTIHFVYAEVTSTELTLHAIDASGKEFDSLVVAP